MQRDVSFREGLFYSSFDAEDAESAEAAEKKTENQSKFSAFKLPFVRDSLAVTGTPGSGRKDV